MRIQVDDEAIAAFCKRNDIQRLLFYGSVLRPDFGPHSDVDVLVEFEPGKPVTYFDLYDLEQELSALVGGRRVDLHTPKELSPLFRPQVLAEGEEHFAVA